jgi:hypothetical protein
MSELAPKIGHLTQVDPAKASQPSSLETGLLKKLSSEGAGSTATEAYSGYAAGRRATENEAGELFQQPAKKNWRRPEKDRRQSDEHAAYCDYFFTSNLA